ncbi:MAG: hypothetical protein KJ070_24740 [Verrucomicrobia bacterium]|nr:hypothetical protein [Verrucomicrobiota bacterium]
MKVQALPALDLVFHRRGKRRTDATVEKCVGHCRNGCASTGAGDVMGAYCFFDGPNCLVRCHPTAQYGASIWRPDVPTPPPGGVTYNLVYWNQTWPQYSVTIPTTCPGGQSSGTTTPVAVPPPASPPAPLPVAPPAGAAVPATIAASRRWINVQATPPAMATPGPDHNLPRHTPEEPPAYAGEPDCPPCPPCGVSHDTAGATAPVEHPSRFPASASVFLHEVTPPDREAEKKLPMPGVIQVQTEREKQKQKWVWWKEWLPYNALAQRFEYEYFDLSSAHAVIGSAREYRNQANLCFMGTKYRNVTKIKIKVDLLLTYWCQFKAFKPKDQGKVLYSTVQSAIPTLRILWAVKNILAAFPDPTAIIESVWGLRESIKNLVDPPPEAKPKFGFTFIRALGKTRTSADWVIDYSDPKTPQTGTFISFEPVFHMMGAKPVPKLCPEAPLMPSSWDPDPRSKDDYIGDRGQTDRLGYLVDPDTGVDRSGLVPDPYSIENLKVILPQLLPWKEPWITRRISFESRQACADKCSSPPPAFHLLWATKSGPCRSRLVLYTTIMTDSGIQ